MRAEQRLLAVFLVLLLPGGGVGCGLMRGNRRPEPDGLVEDMRRGRRPMGQVMVVEAAKGFVLVRSPLAATTEVERELLVKEQGTAATTAKLKVSPERKRNMIAADIVEGHPQPGDVVFYVSGERVTSTSPPPAEGSGAAGRSGGIKVEPATTGATPDPREPELSTASLPPLGEPSGPREIVPEFPGLPSLSEQDGMGPLDEGPSSELDPP